MATNTWANSAPDQDTGGKGRGTRGRDKERGTRKREKGGEEGPGRGTRREGQARGTRKRQSDQKN
jgi:hypothetical protein